MKARVRNRPKKRAVDQYAGSQRFVAPMGFEPTLPP
jgi:hypothetical protein